jgi:hypothetical protein
MQVAAIHTTPKYGFHMGFTNTAGCVTARTTAKAPTATAPVAPRTAHAASTQINIPNAHHRADPHRTPWAMSIRTGNANIQYCKGPGENAVCPAQLVAWLIWPRRGVREVNTAHERMLTTA